MGQGGLHLDWSAVVWVLLAGLVLVPLFGWRSKQPQPRIRFSNLEGLKVGASGLRSHFSRLPKTLILGAMLLTSLGALDIHWRSERDSRSVEGPRDLNRDSTTERVRLPTEGIGIYLVLDVSGSMREMTETSQRQRVRRIDLLKAKTKEFIRSRFDDMVGLITFSRTAEVKVPLTLDHTTLLSELNKVQPTKNPDNDGTAIGYAIYKTVNLVASARYFSQELVKEGEPSYAMHNSIVVMVTDGFHNPHPSDRGHKFRGITVDQAAQYAAENDVRLYIIDIEPAILRSEFKGRVEEMKSAAESTGGKFFVTQGNNTLEALFARIDKIEKALLPQSREIEAQVEDKLDPEGWRQKYNKIPFYPALLTLALILLITAATLESTLLRRVP